MFVHFVKFFFVERNEEKKVQKIASVFVIS
jgi:hypothetical protein